MASVPFEFAQPVVSLTSCVGQGECMRAHDPHDRRLRRRFNLQLDLRCTLLGTRTIVEGKTSDISSLAVRFQSGHRLPLGQEVKLSLLWPVRLDNRWPLQLVMYG